MSEELAYRTTKIPLFVYEQLKMAKGKILLDKRVLSRLPKEVLSPSECPVCGERLVETRMGRRWERGRRWLACSKCAYNQPIVEPEGPFTDGDLIALAVASLLYVTGERGRGREQA
jgi:formate dehydrogenase maturation protein FdhE